MQYIKYESWSCKKIYFHFCVEECENYYGMHIKPYEHWVGKTDDGTEVITTGVEEDGKLLIMFLINLKLIPYWVPADMDIVINGYIPEDFDPPHFVKIRDYKTMPVLEWETKIYTEDLLKEVKKYSNEYKILDFDSEIKLIKYRPYNTYNIED